MVRARFRAAPRPGGVIKFRRAAAETSSSPPRAYGSFRAGTTHPAPGAGMITHRRTFEIAKDQPFLRQRRLPRRAAGREPSRPEADFWRSFNLEKFAQDWRLGVGRREQR